MDAFYDKEHAGEAPYAYLFSIIEQFKPFLARILDEVIAERMRTSSSPKMYRMDMVSFL